MVVIVMVNSPMIQMMAIMFSHPAMLGDGQELIEYDAGKTILTKKSNGAELQIKIGPKDMATGTVRNKGEVFLLKQLWPAGCEQHESRPGPVGYFRWQGADHLPPPAPNGLAAQTE
ncbi:MAG: hypothetical protein P1V35_15250 [Planctomycetota bacterium]|nr:hypothetical protein [Planctomycetota bacterium]